MPFIELVNGDKTEVDEQFMHLSQYRYRNVTGYAARLIYCKESKKSGLIYLHKEILPAPKGYQVDHINRNRLDNRLQNLRVCTWSQNQRNKKIQANNTSGYKGVSYHKKDKAWMARARWGGRNLHLGMFKCPIQAAKAYDSFVKKHCKEFAVTNF